MQSQINCQMLSIQHVSWVLFDHITFLINIHSRLVLAENVRWVWKHKLLCRISIHGFFSLTTEENNLSNLSPRLPGLHLIQIHNQIQNCDFPSLM